MVRTKADRVPTKAVGGKAPTSKAAANNAPTRKMGNNGKGKGKNYSGGNPYHPRETPEWQKPITCFLNQQQQQQQPSMEDSASIQPLPEVTRDENAFVGNGNVVKPQTCVEQ